MPMEFPLYSNESRSSIVSTSSTLTTANYSLIIDSNTTAPIRNDGDDETIPVYWGFIATVIAIIFYGVNYAPVKRFDTGDGMFFQWVYCAAAVCTGLVIHLIRKCPTFHPIVVVGGFFYATGNICVVPIIKCIGLGLGLCIWGILNLFSGWATGRFGLFGVKEQIPSDLILNYIGVALAVSSAVIFALVKNETTKGASYSTEEEIDVGRTQNLQQINSIKISQNSYQDTSDPLELKKTEKTHADAKGNDDLTLHTKETDESFVDKLGPRGKRIVGLALCVISGVCYGQTFTPATYVQDNYEGASQNGLDYVFATSCGVFLTSTFYFLLYAAYQRNLPRLYPRIVLAGFIAGVMWCLATGCWFVANRVLSQAVAFPIVSTGPGVITACLGVFVFHEIKVSCREIG